MPRFQLSKTAMAAASRMVTVSRPHIRTATPSLLTLRTYSTSHNSCLSSLFSRRPALSTNNTARESLEKLTIPTLSTQMRLFSASASLAGKRATYRPSRLVQKRRHGFLARLRTRGGRKILMRRRLKGRKDLSW